MHWRYFRLIAIGLLIVLLASPVLAIPAFPGAEGAGANATGGRPIEKLNYYPSHLNPVLEKRGIVYHVTTLDPDPQGVIEGSLRYGLKSENFWYRTHPFTPQNIDDPDTFDVTPRIIVFDVGGTIDLSVLSVSERDIDITPMNFTIAGQTAPGGITIHGGEFNPGHREQWDNSPLPVYEPKTNNMVLRNFAVRTNDPNEKDALWIPATNTIADHLSLSWYTDEGVSITDNARNVTLQHSIIGPGWNSPDGDGGQIEGKTPMADISVHHNLYIHNDARNPRVGEKVASGAPGVELDFRNNVIYNWNDSQAGYSVASEPSFNNFVNNYYIGGPGNGINDNIFNSGGSISQSTAKTSIYQSGNFLDLDKNGTAGGSDPGWTRFAGSELQQNAPYAVPHGVTQSPAEALATVQGYVGARWWDRDFLDARNMSQLATFGQGTVAQTGQVLNTIAQTDIDTVVNADSQERLPDWDTDYDGMPDYWEEQYGLDPNSPVETPDWKLDYDGDGYINIEEYINEIAEWPAPYDMVFTSGTNSRFAQITNWSITRSSPGEADTTTNWQPSKFDVAVINNGTVAMDAVGQHAGTVKLGTNPGDNATLNITAGWLEVEDVKNDDDEDIGPGEGDVVIGVDAGATAVLNLSGGRLIAKTLNRGALGTFSFTGGVLSAETVGFTLENNGGTIAPGNSVGQTHVMGDLELSDGATLEIEIAPTETASEADFVLVDDAVILDGNLNVVLLEGFAPDENDSWLILSATDIEGQFDFVTEGYSVEQIGNDLYLQLASEVVLVGDYNGDGKVSAADFTVWRDNLGAETLANRDPNNSGPVDIEDFNSWKANYGATLDEEGMGAAALIPEPGSLAILLLGCVTIIWRGIMRRCAE